MCLQVHTLTENLLSLVEYRTKMSPLILTLLLTSIALAFTLNITPVPDGVVVQERGEARAVEGEISLYVRIETPDVIEMFQQLEPLVDAAQRAVQAANYTSDTLHLISKRLSRMKEIIVINREPSPTRRKRGLIDLFGTIGKSLFGIATEADVEAVRTMTADVSHETITLRKAHNQLVGTVNHVIEVVHSVEEEVENLEHAVSVLDQYKDRMASIIAKVDTATALSALTSWLELLLAELRHSVEAQHRRVDHCQGGIVSEDLIPRNFFSKLRQEFGTESSLSDQWYYQHLKVGYYFERDGSVVCKILVPILKAETYLDFWINTFPIRKDEAILRVHHDVKVALGTSGGTLFFQNDNCIGQSPIVCQPGLIFGQEHELCLRAMVLGDDLGKESCSVHVSTFDQGHTLFAVGRNIYAVYTEDVTYSYRCQGQKGVRGILQEGVYLISLDSSCIFDTQDWYLEGITYHERTTYLNYSKVKFPQFPKLTLNWTKPILTFMETRGQKTHRLPDIKAVPTVAEEPLHEKVAKHPIAITVMWISIALCLLAFIAIYCCCDRRFSPICQKLKNRQIPNRREIIHAWYNNPAAHSLEAEDNPGRTDIVNTAENSTPIFPSFPEPSSSALTSPAANNSLPSRCSTGVQAGHGDPSI